MNIDYNFTKSGTSNFGDLAAPGYGTANVHTVGNDLLFTINLLNGAWFVDTGTHHAVTFNLGTSGLAFSGLPSPFTGVNNGPFHNPGFNGDYNYAVNCSFAGNGANSCSFSPHVSTLSFTMIGAGQLAPVLRMASSSRSTSLTPTPRVITLGPSAQPSRLDRSPAPSSALAFPA